MFYPHVKLLLWSRSAKRASANLMASSIAVSQDTKSFFNFINCCINFTNFYWIPLILNWIFLVTRVLPSVSIDNGCLAWRRLLVGCWGSGGPTSSHIPDPRKPRRIRRYQMFRWREYHQRKYHWRKWMTWNENERKCNQMNRKINGSKRPNQAKQIQCLAWRAFENCFKSCLYKATQWYALAWAPDVISRR